MAEIDDGQEQAEIARALWAWRREDLDENLPIQAVSTGLSSSGGSGAFAGGPGTLSRQSAACWPKFTRKSSGATGCYAFTRETIEIGEARAHARFFAPGDNIAEDPATGSAAGALGGYLVHHGATGVEPIDGVINSSSNKVISCNRPSRINLEVKRQAGRG